MSTIFVDHAYLELSRDEFAATLYIHTTSTKFQLELTDFDIQKIYFDYAEDCVRNMIFDGDLRVPSANTVMTIQGKEYSFPDAIIDAITRDMTPLISEYGEEDETCRTLQ